MKRILFIAFFALASSGCAYFVSTTGADVPLDSKAPPFELTDQQGETVSLDALLADGPVVIEFWRGEFCSYGTKRIKNLDEESAEFLSVPGATLVAISHDDPQTLKTFAADHDIDFRLLSDPQAEVIDDYGVRMKGTADGDQHVAVPSTVVVSERGEVVWAHVGDTVGDFAKSESIARALQAAGTAETSVATAHFFGRSSVSAESGVADVSAR